MRTLSYFVLILVFLGIYSCDNTEVPKPANLIPRQKMIEMMADMHLTKAFQQNNQYHNDSIKLTSTNIYYSVLAKYRVADSIYVRSVVYYSSYPKEYEKMYNDVINILMEKEPKEPEKQKINVGNE